MARNTSIIVTGTLIGIMGVLVAALVILKQDLKECRISEASYYEYWRSQLLK
jgi:hypothetical protein